jgi:Spy/CpxP family protein refolding chaperone
MKRILTSITFCFVALSASRALDAESLKKYDLIHPNVLRKNLAEIELTPEQKTQIDALESTTKPKITELESGLAKEMRTLEELLKQPETTPEAASLQLSKVTLIEADLKQTLLQTFVKMRLLLTPEQRRKALSLAPAVAQADRDLEARIQSEAQKFKQQFENLNLPLTKALKERAATIDKMIKDGGLERALKALDELAKETGIKELTKTEDIDYSKFAPGTTDLEVLKARLQEVQDLAQEVISVQVLEKLAQARTALEQAKQNEDVERLGRILSFAESLLKKKSEQP